MSLSLQTSNVRLRFFYNFFIWPNSVPHIRRIVLVPVSACQPLSVAHNYAPDEMS